MSDAKAAYPLPFRRAAPSGFSAADNWAACWRWRPRGWLEDAHLFRRARCAGVSGLRRAHAWRRSTTKRRWRNSPQPAMRSPMSSRTCRAAAVEHIAADQADQSQARGARHRAGPLRREELRPVLGLKTAAFFAVDIRRRCARRVRQARRQPAILKTRRFGYDGKGRRKSRAPTKRPRRSRHSRRAVAFWKASSISPSRPR